jgi:hypothetical protein
MDPCGLKGEWALTGMQRDRRGSECARRENLLPWRPTAGPEEVRVLDLGTDLRVEERDEHGF